MDATKPLDKMRAQKLLMDEATQKLDMGAGRKEEVLGYSWVSGLSKYMVSFAVCWNEDTEDPGVGVERKIMKSVWSMFGSRWL